MTPAGGWGRPAVLRRCAVVGAVGAAVLLGLPTAAFAHGIGGTSETASGFVWLGFKHMLAGWDHLLFVAGVVLLAGQVKRAAKLISLFALGHSITLIVATLAQWRINATLVDIVIVLSLVFVGVVGWFGRPTQWLWFAAAVLGFGLVHGLGLSTRLQDLVRPEDGVLARVIAFNVGVELGQLMAVVGMFMLGDVLRTYITWSNARRAAHAGLAVVGLVAAVVLVVVWPADNGASTAAVGCEVRKRTETYPAGGGHPAKTFFEPADTVPDKGFGHLMGDGFVIVHYQASLPADQVDQLRAYVTDSSAGKVVGAPASGQAEAVKAVHAYDTLLCGKLDVPALKHFADDWLTDPRSSRPQE
ncbi:MAG: Hydrogenase/urease accessory protein HupE [Dactylosporangium sp.]|jgi:hydrogenase/urease accessory protein HupE|nr:Hydrogenase/urease accessory protein HupE [Dactylosporangium sp.]